MCEFVTAAFGLLWYVAGFLLLGIIIRGIVSVFGELVGAGRGGSTWQEQIRLEEEADKEIRARKAATVSQ